MSGPQFDQRKFASQERGTTDGRALHYKKRGAAAGNRYPNGRTRTDLGDGRSFLLVTLPPCEKPAFIFDDATSTAAAQRRECNGAASAVESGVPKRLCMICSRHATERRAYKRERPTERPGIEYRNFNIKQRAIECRSILPGNRSSHGTRIGLTPKPIQFVSTRPICICSFHPGLPNFLTK